MQYFKVKHQNKQIPHHQLSFQFLAPSELSLQSMAHWKLNETSLEIVNRLVSTRLEASDLPAHFCVHTWVDFCGLYAIFREKILWWLRWALI